MIAEQMTQLAQKLDRLATLRDASTKAEKLRTPRQELEKAQQDLARLVSRAELYAGRKLLSLPQLAIAGKTLEQLAKVRERVKEDTEKLTEGTSYRTLRNRLEDCVDALKDATTKAWQTWLAEHTARLDAGELARIEVSAPVLAAQVRQHQQKVAALSIPDTEQEFADAEKVLDALRTAVGKLQPYLTTDKEVLAFLDAVNRGGAALTLYTPAVLKYLSDNKLAGQFRVVRGEPATTVPGRRR